MMLVAQTEAPDIEQAKEVGLQLLDRVSECVDRIISGDYLAIIIAGCLLAAIAVGSGAMASSIAEGRTRGREFHFFVGMLIPVAYPALVFFTLHRKVFEKEEVKEMYLGNAGDKELTSEFDLDSILNYDFFHSAMFDEVGNPRGPFMMMVDDVELRVERIAEVMPTVVVLETVNADGKLQTMRLPYNRISACREI